MGKPKRQKRNISYEECPEAATLATHPRFQPWMIELQIRKSAVDPRIHFTCYYARAADAVLARHACEKAWMRWERAEKGVGLYEPYPAIQELADATVLDESDWDSVWSDARKHPHLYAGSILNPLVFTFHPVASSLIVAPGGISTL